MTRVLVAYVTQFEATRDIAQAIAAGFREAGADVDVQSASEVRTLEGFDAIVVGSGVYANRWNGEGIDFLKRFDRQLRALPTWLFSSGPTGGDAKAERKMQEVLEAQPPAPGEAGKWATRIHARGHAWFAGRISDATASKAGLFARFVPRGDWVDPAAAHRFGSSIAAELPKPARVSV